MLTAEQLEIRKTGIGGSEIAAVLGLSVFAAPFDVWLSKTQGWTQAETEDMRRGTFLEDGIARWYAQRYGIEEKAMHSPTTLRHRTHPWALCTSDRIVSVQHGQRERIVSIKSPRRGFDWGEAGTDNVRGEYLLQLQWEWAIHSSHGPGLDEEMHLAALVDGELNVYPTQADRELQAWLIDFAGKWWERHVVGGEQPPLDGSTQATEWLKRKFPRVVEEERDARPNEVRLMASLQVASAESERWSQEEETIRNELRLSMGTAGRINAPNGYATWLSDKNGKRSFRTKFNKEK